MDSTLVDRAAQALLESGDDALTEASMRTGAFGEARRLLEAARSKAAGESDGATEAAAIDRLGMVLHYENIMTLISGGEVSETDAAREEALFRQALSIWQELADRDAIAESLFGIGLVFQVLRGDWETAMPLFTEACEIVDDSAGRADLYLRSEVHRHLGFYFLVEGRQPEVAVRHLAVSLQLREQLGDARRIPSGLVALGQAELAAGDAVRAAGLLRRAVSEARAAGLLQHWIADAESSLREAEAALATDASATDAPGNSARRREDDGRSGGG